MFGKRETRVVIVNMDKIPGENNNYVLGRISGIMAGICDPYKEDKTYVNVQPDGSNLMIMKVKASGSEFRKLKEALKAHYPGICTCEGI